MILVGRTIVLGCLGVNNPEGLMNILNLTIKLWGEVSLDDGPVDLCGFIFWARGFLFNVTFGSFWSKSFIESAGVFWRNVLFFYHPHFMVILAWTKDTAKHQSLLRISKHARSGKIIFLFLGWLFVCCGDEVGVLVLRDLLAALMFWGRILLVSYVEAIMMMFIQVHP